MQTKINLASLKILKLINLNLKFKNLRFWIQITLYTLIKKKISRSLIRFGRKRKSIEGEKNVIRKTLILVILVLQLLESI